MADELERIPEDLRFLYEELQRETPESRDEYGTHLTAEVGRELIERLADLQAKLEEKERELVSCEESLDAQRVKFESCPHTAALNQNGKSAYDLTCGCSHDHPEDVCALHAPQLRNAEAELQRLRTENAALIANIAQSNESAKGTIWDKYMKEHGIEEYQAQEIAELKAKNVTLQAELEQEREDARRIIGLRQDRIDVLTAELGNVRTQWNRMRIAKERAEAKNAALESRLETLTKPVTDEETASWDDETLRDYRGEFDRILSSRSQQAPASEEK